MESVVKAIESGEKILIVGHIMPDGDDLSSVMALGEGLERLGKEIVMGIDYKIPWFFEDVLEIEKIVDYESYEKLNFKPDLMVIVDVSSLDRIGNFKELIGKIPVAVIDHHSTNNGFADYNWVDPTFGACAQMVLRINRRLGVEYDERLAHINLVGILTDTGFLRFPNADVRVFEDVTDLIKKGAKPHVIARAILENKRLEQFKLFAEVLEKLEMELDGLLAYSYVSQEMYSRHNCTDEDSSGFVHELRSLKGVEVAVMFLEYQPEKIHVSMRSKSWFNVAQFAVKLGGGGHPNAAGASIDGKLEEVMKRVVSELKDEIIRSRPSYLSR